MAKQPKKDSSGRKPKPAQSRRGSSKEPAAARKRASPVKQLPKTENALVLRTDFSDDAAWESLCAAIRAPVGEFRAYVDCVSDPRYDGLTVERVTALAPQGSEPTFVFLADRAALTHPERPILVVDLCDQPGRTFRVIPSEMWGVENNLSIANMDFDEFADNVDPDGIFRGFPEG
jgi:hypothetical protein